jgi:membrane-associated phospholipid phosphatase
MGMRGSHVVLCLLVVSAIGLLPAAADDTGEPTVPRGLFSGYDYEICSSCFLDEELDRELGGGLSLAPARAGSWAAPRWLTGDVYTGTWIATGALGLGWAALWVDGDEKQIRDVGDITQLLPLATGLGMSLGTRDWQGVKQWGFSLLSATATVHALKHTNNKYRPDGTDTKSFPSGHTQASFSGAGYIYQRYGPRWGIPALVMASYTGFSRVYGQKHFADDVISGASIAMFYNFLFTRPADPNRLAWDRDMERERRWRFEWENAEGNVSKNVVQAPNGSGTVLDFRFDQVANPQITASVAVDGNFKGRHHIKMRYTPFEVRDVGTLQEDTIFGDVVFPKGTDIWSIYFLGDIRARYAYELVPDSRFSAQVGGGLSVIVSEVRLSRLKQQGNSVVVDENYSHRIADRGVAPLLYLRAGVDILDWITLYPEGDGFTSSKESAYDVAAKLLFQINPKWGVAIGWRWTADDLELDEIRNDFASSGSLLHIAYSF